MSSVSVVIPAKDERDNIKPLVDEIYQALDGRYPFEIIYIDDGSTDGTFEEIVRLKQQEQRSVLRVYKHQQSVGQSTAIHQGVQHANGDIIVTLDADGQNDPADIPRMLAEAYNLPDGSDFCIAGWRKNRKDTAWYRLQSKFANKIRGSLLKDGTPDTGCGLKVFAKQSFLKFPYFDHMHRFIPALTRRLGGKVVVVEVNHRDRNAGVSKYNMWNRLWVGIFDLFGVMWLQRRVKHPKIIDHA